MKYFYQSVPSFYQFFYLPISGVCTILFFLYGLYPLITIPIVTLVLLYRSIKTRDVYFLWVALFMLSMTAHLLYINHAQKIFSDLYHNKKINCCGVITDIKKNICENSIILKTTSLNSTPSEHIILIHYPHYMDSLNIGDALELNNIHISCAKESYKWYTYKEGICATSHIQKSNMASLKKNTKRKHIFDLNKTYSTLIETIILGIKINNPHYSHIKNICNWWGIRHYLARSGLHFSILFFIILYLLTFLSAPWFIKQACISIVCVIVFTSTGYSISFLRAFIFYLLITLCNIFYIRILPIHLLNIAFCGILLWNPYSICFLDLQLTFCATYLLLWYSKIDLFKKYS